MQYDEKHIKGAQKIQSKYKFSHYRRIWSNLFHEPSKSNYQISIGTKSGNVFIKVETLKLVADQKPEILFSNLAVLHKQSYQKIISQKDDLIEKNIEY